MIVAGVGCRRACAAEDILAVIRRAATLAGHHPHAVAAPAFKQAERGLRAACDALGLPLLLVTEQDLRGVQARCRTPSAAALRHAGVASVAEGAALAAAGPTARLILPRIQDARATCALACAENDVNTGGMEQGEPA